MCPRCSFVFDKVASKAFERSERKQAFEKHRSKKDIDKEEAQSYNVSFGIKPKCLYEKKPYVPPHNRRNMLHLMGRNLMYPLIGKGHLFLLITFPLIDGTKAVTRLLSTLKRSQFKPSVQRI